MIEYWDRKNSKLEIEKVYGGAFVQFCYQNWIGALLTRFVLVRKWISQLVGWYKSTSMSARAIPSFVEKYEIQMDDFEQDQPFGSFNDFFIRKFKPARRVFVENSNQLGAIAEARYLAFESITNEMNFPVKGQYLNYGALLGESSMQTSFEGGALLIARLCPVDYHRFHFPDDGCVLKEYRVSGVYHSVNPVAIRACPQLFIQNERHVSILETKNFGLLAMIEVGAMCVGKIVQSYSKKEFRRGQEKGYFLFGGSTVILIGQKGIWSPSVDLVQNTKNKRETLIRLGEEIGVKNQSQL